MEIIIGKTAGFCFGVANAVNKTKKALKEYKDVSCLGELVHNNDVTQELQNEGLKFIKNIEEASKNVIIRAHGEPKETYKKAKKLKLNVIDLTCPKVTKIHNLAEEYRKNRFYIFLIGQRKHPETIGTISYCGENASIIEKEEDIKDALNTFNNSRIKNLVIICQTTFSLEKFETFSSIIKKSINKETNLEIKNTICSATKQRQDEVLELSKQVDTMIIIGGKHSSNTNKLYTIALANCKNSILIENEKELNKDVCMNSKKIGIMAGASTPKNTIEKVVELLKSI